MEILNRLGELSGQNTGNEETIMDPIIRTGLNLMVQRFGYANVSRVLKAMKPKKSKV